MCLSRIAHEPRLPKVLPFQDSGGGVIGYKGQGRVISYLD